MNKVEVFIAFVGGAAIVRPHWDSSIDRIDAIPAQKVVLPETVVVFKRRGGDRQPLRMGSDVFQPMKPAKYDFDEKFRKSRSWKTYRRWQFHNK